MSGASLAKAAPQLAEAAPACNVCAAWRPTGISAEAWATAPIRERLRILKQARHIMASQSEALAQAISPNLARTQADTLVTELLPLLEACKFLERNAERLLRPRKLGPSGRPFWLGGVHAEVHREPLGHVLVIGPANFPLFLPGAQVLQALAAGNHVTWKPGAGGVRVAELVADALRSAGLPGGVLRITDDTTEAAHEALAAGAHKVIFTGSAATGHAVLHELADTATPAVMELSGADAVIILPGADLQTVAKAVAFGLRLNGGAVCMSPRRLFAEAAQMQALRPLLKRELSNVPPVALDPRTATTLLTLTQSATASGAELHGELTPYAQRPLLIDQATPAMDITRVDIFAPVLSLLTLRCMLELPEAYAACPYTLTASIFCSRGDERRARTMARTLRAGTVLINDLIAPTADPRIPFGGRGASGYGATRGAEGLLEMTATKTLLVRRGGRMRHLEPTQDQDAPLLLGLIRASHARTWGERWSGLRAVMRFKRGGGA